MNRRTMLKSLLSTCVLTLGGVTSYQYYLQSQDNQSIESRDSLEFLTDEDQMLLDILIPVFVSSNILKKLSSNQPIIKNIDAAIVRLPVRTQTELKELFSLLGSMLGRLIVANVWSNWTAASAESIDTFLNQWRESQFELLQVAYKGLHKLIIGSAYAEPHSWQVMEYAGPPKLFSEQV